MQAVHPSFVSRLAVVMALECLAIVFLLFEVSEEAGSVVAP